jgi:SAM-dependent methyltransferase
LLDEPHYHRVRPGEVNRFRGLALALDGEPIDAITAGSLTVPVNLPSRDLAAFVNLPRAANCRFDFEMRFEAPFEFAADGEVLFRYQPVPGVVVDAPMPPPEIIEITQGGRNVDAYRDSIVSGHTTMKAILASDPRSILDIGCGTGRLLLGWHAEDATRRLAGVDINASLIAWNRENLGQVADWRVTPVEPPLPFDDGSFDLIQLVSVFTHLPLHIQQMWVSEILRLLRPRGQAIVTLHGEVYALVFLQERLRHQFELDGHISITGAAEGSNAFASFHTERFARELFAAFDVAYYERGPRDLFPIATFQDVYVLTKC